MSLGALQNEGDLQRWLEQQLEALGIRAKPDLPIRTGSDEVIYPGEASATEALAIDHGFNVPPKVFLQITGGNSGFNSQLEREEVTDSQFVVVGYNPGEPEEGAVVTFDWMAVSL